MAVEHVTTRDGRRIEVETFESAPRRRRADRYIGCPVEWLKHVLPLARSKEQLAVAIWLHRRRAVCPNEAFTVPNGKLTEELGLSRHVKYKALRRFEKAGVIDLIRNNRHALQVRFRREWR